MNNSPFMQGAATQHQAIPTHKVLKNTYLLLSFTLLFSAITAGIAIATDLGHIGGLVCMLLAFVMMFVVNKTADSSKGLVAIFAFTGLMGASIGPMLDNYLAMSNGPQLVLQALGGTALIFFSLSAYVLTTKKDFSFMGGFLMVGLILVVIASIANIFLAIPAFSLAISGVVILVMSGLILFDTSRIINGGETNYIRATVSLYLNIYNIFVNLLYILGITNDD